MDAPVLLHEIMKKGAIIVGGIIYKSNLGKSDWTLSRSCPDSNFEELKWNEIRKDGGQFGRVNSIIFPLV